MITADVPWKGAEADAVCRKVVERKLGMFQCFPDVDKDDLIQEAITAARIAWPKFDPARHPSKNAWSTFVYTVAARRLIDLYRHRQRRAVREAAAAIAPGMAAPPEPSPHDDDAPPAGPVPLVDWLGRVYRAAQRTTPPRRGRRGRTWFSPAQVAAIVLLMRHRRLSTRGVRDLLITHGEVRRVLGIRHVPSQSWFVRAEKFASDNLRIPGGE